MSATDIRSCLPRRDDAWHVWTRNPTAHQGHTTADSRRHGDKERGGGHHGSGHRQEDCRLPHQARKSHADPPLPEEEHTQPGDCHRGDTDRLSAELPEHINEDFRLPQHRRLERGV